MKPEVSKLFEKTEDDKWRGWRYREQPYEIDFSEPSHQKFKESEYVRVYENGRVVLNTSPHGRRGADLERRDLMRDFGIEFSLLRRIRDKLYTPDMLPIRKAWIYNTNTEYLLDRRHGMVLCAPSWRGNKITYYSEHARPTGGIPIQVAVPNRKAVAEILPKLNPIRAFATTWKLLSDGGKSYCNYYYHRSHRRDVATKLLCAQKDSAEFVLDPQVEEHADALRFLASLHDSDYSVFVRWVSADHHTFDHLRIEREMQ